MVQHGQLFLRGDRVPRSTYYDQGTFGRLFPWLPSFAPDTERERTMLREALMRLGELDGPMDAARYFTYDNDNPQIPAGFTYLGQFIDHDVTFDPTSSLERQVDPEAIANFRTPALELDSVYGSGRAVTPHFYDKRPAGNGLGRPTPRLKMLLDDGWLRDVPRNSQNTAIIPDPRNDENMIVSQLHVAFLRFHNAALDWVITEEGITDGNRAFDRAQQLVRWHYQWIVLHEFLPRIVGPEIVDRLLREVTAAGNIGASTGTRIFNWRNEPFIPVEFSVGAYRYGHSQVRPLYRVNDEFLVGNPRNRRDVPIFNVAQPRDPVDPDDLSGGGRAPRRYVDWRNFFVLDYGRPPQASKLINTILARPLFELPFVPPNLPGNPASLAQRNLLRHLTFDIPSGQSIAKTLGETPLRPDAFQDEGQLYGPLATSTPLWFYILREADLQQDGERLGAVGGRIVAEVLIGLLIGDRKSYLCQDPDWRPLFPSYRPGEDFQMADLLRFAGVAS